MAKKKTNNTSKIEKKTVAKKDIQLINEQQNDETIKSLLEDSVGCCDGYCEAYKRKLEIVGIEQLIAFEKAASIVCGRYEIKARLSGEDNVKFNEFVGYHQLIVEELEKRVIEVCKTK